MFGRKYRFRFHGIDMDTSHSDCTGTTNADVCSTSKCACKTGYSANTDGTVPLTATELPMRTFARPASARVKPGIQQIQQEQPV
ncbi:hypothetical protein DPMN_156002 [Dreissena polymorpha]|uniref:EB domain-containing protein n=1 Tax=Dreissena polymorpha TaxID=45954 RepID=A0A9D4JBW6_DREPO|nr:hypothetical protein DPMN_156002 [Dreissena polymorpha]